MVSFLLEKKRKTRPREKEKLLLHIMWMVCSKFSGKVKNKTHSFFCLYVLLVSYLNFRFSYDFESKSPPTLASPFSV